MNNLKQQTMEWISVKDRLPEHATKVLAINITSYGQDVCTGYFYQDEQTWRYIPSLNDSIEVTHWMPLPKPPSNE